MIPFHRLSLALGLTAGAAFVQAAPSQEAYRLAFSKAEDIEVFVDDASAQSWCASTIALRAVLGASAAPDAWDRLLPKLGALFSQQCPQATRVDWRVVNAVGAQRGAGHSLAANGWQPETSVSQPPVAAAPAEAEPAPPAPAPDAVVAVAQADTAAPREAATAAPAQPAASAAAAPTIPPDTATGSVSPAPSASPPPAAPAAAAPRRTGHKLAAFAVGEWQPPAPGVTAIPEDLLTPMKDQNGCTVLTRFRLGGQAQYLRLETQDVSCDANGMAHGKGQLRVVRSDGAVLARSSGLWFVQGVPFTSNVGPLALVDVVHVQSRERYVGPHQVHLWFGLGSDAALKSHYLLQAYLTQGQYFDAIEINALHVLAGEPESFRDLDEILTAVDRALSVVGPDMLHGTGRLSLLFADDMEHGLAGGNERHQLYSVQSTRRLDWRTGKPLSEWSRDLQYARNHLFQREAQLAAEKKREKELAEQARQQQAANEARARQREAERAERERKAELAREAREERQALAQHGRLQELAEQGFPALLANVERDVRFELSTNTQYSRLIRGSADRLTRVVRVAGKDGADARVDWPYPMRLIGQAELAKGWYWVSGERRLDAGKRDEDGLPMTMVDTTQGSLQACAQQGCTDVVDPLALTRLQLGKPDWSPENARKLIEAATAATPHGLIW